ncbi:hypothetical protein [uncultured Brachyspira sp.]|uniref:hypothetical protein n=1 Tax=uncultured Brachyspira sp. TaxID=221953 RepID=UPI00260D0E46|nr:hypothetical protein [uncultured Brachyspira sp.]
MGFLDYIKSAWEWVKSAIQKVWSRFKVFIVKVANWIKTIVGVIKSLIKSLVAKVASGLSYVAGKIADGLSIVKEQLKNGVKKLFLVFTKKNANGLDFTEIIKKAKAEGKMGTDVVDSKDLFEDAQTSDYDIHIIQTDAEFNTENVYSVSANELSEELRAKAMAHEVTEINLKGI